MRFAAANAVPAPPVRTPSWARLGPLTGAGLTLAVVLLFAVSGGMLWLVGYNYDGLTGGSVTKIHPASYLIGLLFGWSILVSGKPVARLVHLASERPASFLLLLVSLALILLTLWRQGAGLGGIVDTYICAALLVMLLADADDPLMARIETLVHVLMTMNALLGLFEFVSKTLIFPYRFDGIAFPDARSTALHGHPLANAAMTCCYMLALLTGGRSLRQTTRYGLIALQAAALVTFGGRTAMVLGLLLGGTYAIVTTMASLRGGRVPLLGAAVAVLVLALVPGAIGGLWAGGFFDALLTRFVSDGGSANARAEMFVLLGKFSLRDLIVGPDLALVDTLRRVNGLEWGIENPFIRMTLYQGAFVTLVVAIAYSLFTWETLKGAHRGPWLPMIAWIILLNGAESVASKTTMPAKFAVMVMCLYRTPPRPALPPVRASWSVQAR